MDSIRKDFTTITLVMIPVAIAINIVIGTLVFALKIPLYLDSIGTVLVGVLAGGWAGALTGLLANLIWGLSGINRGRCHWFAGRPVQRNRLDPASMEGHSCRAYHGSGGGNNLSADLGLCLRGGDWRGD